MSVADLDPNAPVEMCQPSVVNDDIRDLKQQIRWNVDNTHSLTTGEEKVIATHSTVANPYEPCEGVVIHHLKVSVDPPNPANWKAPHIHMPDNWRANDLFLANVADNNNCLGFKEPIEDWYLDFVWPTFRGNNSGAHVINDAINNGGWMVSERPNDHVKTQHGTQSTASSGYFFRQKYHRHHRIWIDAYNYTADHIHLRPQLYACDLATNGVSLISPLSGNSAWSYVGNPTAMYVEQLSVWPMPPSHRLYGWCDIIFVPYIPDAQPPQGGDILLFAQMFRGMDTGAEMYHYWTRSIRYPKFASEYEGISYQFKFFMTYENGTLIPNGTIFLKHLHGNPYPPL